MQANFYAKIYCKLSDFSRVVKETMLIQFTIQNFLSFRDEITFSMLGVDSEQQHLEHLVKNADKEGRALLPLAAIYGANAAGKSNLIKAISFVKTLVTEGTRSNKNIPVSPFKLGKFIGEPSKFEIIFTYKDTRYSYGFKLNREQIFEEWLYAIPSKRKKEVMYFERITSIAKETTVEYGSTLLGKNEKHQPFLNFIAQGTRPNQLFLTEAIERNVQLLIPVVNWFKDVLTVISAEANVKNLEIKIQNDKAFTDFLSHFLKFAGTGIESVLTETVHLDVESHFSTIPKQVINDILEDIESLEKNSVLIIEDSRSGRIIISKNQENQLVLTELKTQHLSENGTLVNFSLEEESEGTQRLINLVPSLFLLRQELEKVVFLDELDRRLHPLLSRNFLEVAIHCRNKNNQLIFTTHDTNLLDLEFLRRDEIWFVEKNNQGVSNCYSLVEFEFRADLKIEKGYLSGRFGAIPFFGDPEKLGWTDCDKN